MPTRKVLFMATIAALLLAGAYYQVTTKNSSTSLLPDTALAAQFKELSENGNSACSVDFMNSIDSMSSDVNIKGSCCSPMDFHRYQEQREGLKKYSAIAEIPADPYNIPAPLAKQLKGYYDITLTPEQQKTYDYAMQHSHEKGPCCCKCWHWYVYGGLAKLLIQKYAFTGAQVADVWNLSDGCGGAGHDHDSHGEKMDHMMQ